MGRCSYLHDAEVNLSLGKQQEWAYKIRTDIHLHDALLPCTGTNNSMAKHALLHTLWPGEDNEEENISRLCHHLMINKM